MKYACSYPLFRSCQLIECLQGIRFHGLTIPDCQKVLPAAPGGKEMTAESMLWLLMTGKIPTEAESRELSRQLAEQGDLPPFIEKLIDSLVTTRLQVERRLLT